MRTIRMGLIVLTLALATLVAGRTASASDCHGRSHITYKAVTEYQTIKEVYTVLEWRYDHCGKPHRVEVSKYRYVQVPVQKRIRVSY